MVLETIDQCKLDKAYQDACKEDKEAEKSLSKLLRQRTASKKQMKTRRLISREKRPLQPKHAHLRILSPPSRQSSCNIPPSYWKKRVDPGPRFSRNRLLLLLYILVLCLLDSQIWWWLSTSTSCPQVKYPLIFLLFGLDMLCHFVVSYHPCPQWSSETGTVLQSQAVSHLCGNFCTVFVAELVGLASVNIIFDTIWKVCLHSYSQVVLHWSG
jgi:hypothetical protein